MLYRLHGEETHLIPEAEDTKPALRSEAIGRTAAVSPVTEFDVVLGLIEAARTRAVSAANQTMVALYWSIGEYISRKIVADGWGKGTVEALAEYVQQRKPNARGYSSEPLAHAVSQRTSPPKLFTTGDRVSSTTTSHFSEPHCKREERVLSWLASGKVEAKF